MQQNIFIFIFLIIFLIETGMYYLKRNIKKKKREIVIFYIVSSISCYRCLSINGSNPSCEDLFQGDETDKPSFLSTPCLTRLRERKGLFHATHCIKLIAHAPGKRKINKFS